MECLTYALCVCDILIICFSHSTISAVVTGILLLPYDCMQLLTCACLKFVVYFSLRVDSEEHD